MAQLASDDFNRADDPHIDAGVGWWTSGGWDTWAFKVLSNQAAPTSAANDEFEYYNVGVLDFPDDQYSQATLLGSGGSPGATNGPGVCVRASGAGIGAPGTDTYYRCVASIGAASNAVVLRKVVNGVFSSIGADVNVAWATGQVMKVEISGSTITTYRDGISVDVRTDSAITSGQPGIAYSSTLSGATIDDWSGGSLDTGVTGVSNRFLLRHSRMTSW